MPFVFLGIGLLLLVVAVRGTHDDMVSLLKSEMTGEKSFPLWISSIVILGFLGYVRAIRPMTNAFIGLVILTMFLANDGFFQKFTEGLKNPVAPTPKPATTPATAPEVPNPTVTAPDGTVQPIPGL